MQLLYQVESEISRIVSSLQTVQYADGSWRMCVDAGPRIDAYMILLMRSLQIGDEVLIGRLAERIAMLQTNNGSWKIYGDEDKGNVSATIECYYALLWAGTHQKTDENMKAAKQFILSEGGIESSSLLTKIMLAVTGQFPWKSHPLLPVELLALPSNFPINLYDFSGTARVHMVPVLVLSDKSYVIRADGNPELSDLWAEPESRPASPSIWSEDSIAYRSILDSIQSGIHQLFLMPKQVHASAVRRAEQYMLERIESDGTFYSYSSATFLMIYALMALGYPKDHPVIMRAYYGLRTMLCQAGDKLLMQNFTSTVWDTALISTAMQTAGVPPHDPSIIMAGNYLRFRQHARYGDWRVHNPDSPPGGWGFSDINTINPDNDDTTAALRAIRGVTTFDPYFRESWNRGLNWLISMQNRDGGWAAFEKNTDKRVLAWIPIENAADIVIDPSTADLTGRTIEFLGRYAGWNMQSDNMRRAVRWLIDHQAKDGSWYGRWGICYIYGTWAALTGMLAVGVSPQHPSVQKAVRWLLDIQNTDGGWGESCKSDIAKKYVPLGASTPSQTAWAVEALIAVFQRTTPEIERGIRCLLELGSTDDWRTSYPTGGGLPGNFYLNYHSYRYIWPLIALCKYRGLKH
ncbi:squalene--hopene cyclase [Paenibacillus sp. N1-5-1-14]|uniref:squalene--hopene cyclase n=1 Tax=Paenibacillus radicibacter TaxID=2972488 RepID=UPI0021599941|nr:squalene--hopene cyclase [Paenibacillus radicibacter]MCR8643378.1 squalene--hopene cyclase [Paenibacillus radicibacter]